MVNRQLPLKINKYNYKNNAIRTVSRSINNPNLCAESQIKRFSFKNNYEGKRKLSLIAVFKKTSQINDIRLLHERNKSLDSLKTMNKSFV